MRSAKKLLGGGDKVKLTVMFRGREITHPDIGWSLLQKLVESLKEVDSIEKQPSMEGKRMIMILAPVVVQQAKAKEEKKESSNAKTKDS